MENVLQQLNWVMLLSHRTNSVPCIPRYRKAWRHLLTTISNLQLDRPANAGTELDAVLEKLYYFRRNYDPADVNSLREFAGAVAAQSGIRIPRTDANILIGATEEIIELLMAG